MHYAQPLARQRHLADIARADKICDPEDGSAALQLCRRDVTETPAGDLKIRPQHQSTNDIEIPGKPASLKLPHEAQSIPLGKLEHFDDPRPRLPRASRLRRNARGKAGSAQAK